MRLGARTLFSWACAVLALCHLPRELVPLSWLLAFCLPAIAFYICQRLIPAPGWLMAFVAGVLQVSAVFLAAKLSAAPDALAALGCTLIPPLIFLQCRLNAGDCVRSLFLSFCLLLVGSILSEPSGLLSILFLVAGALALHADVDLHVLTERHSWISPPLTLPARIRRSSSLAAASILVCALLFQTFQALPAPGKPAEDVASNPASRSNHQAQVGLSSTFEFGNFNGTLNLNGSRILKVQALDRRPLPSNLYLRTSYFDLAGLDRWERAEAQRSPVPVQGDLLATRDDSPRRSLEVTLLSGTDGKMFMPASSINIDGPASILGDPGREFYQSSSPLPAGTQYRVGYQERSRLAERHRLDRRNTSQLTALPDELLAHDRLFRDVLLATRANLGSRFSAPALANALGEVLRKRCRYSLEEPNGPHGHPLLDFLDGDQHGFCMHFASVTAICLRMAGVPCRIGVGLQGGELEGTDRIFGSQHAHAWVEIPFTDLGWIIFDPSPAVGISQALDSSLDSEEVPSSVTDDSSSDSTPAATALEVLSKPFSYPWLWLGLVLLVFMPFRRGRQQPDSTSLQKLPKSLRPCRKLLSQLLKALAEHGHRRRRGQTLEGFLQMLQGVETLPLGQIRIAVRAYQEVRFGGRSFNNLHRQNFEKAISSIRGCLPQTGI